MAVYRFRVSFEEFDEIVREVDIKTTQTFEDLHRAIQGSVGYSPEKSSSFYVSSDHWIKGDEIAYLPNQRKIDRGVTLMEKAKLSNFIDDPHQKFYYIYNFDRPFDFHVQLIKIILENEPGKVYPFIFKSTGEAPKLIDNNGAVSYLLQAKEKPEDFDFMNEAGFEAEDADELEAMTARDFNAGEKAEDAPSDDDDKDSDDYAEHGDDDDDYSIDDSKDDDY